MASTSTCTGTGASASANALPAPLPRRVRRVVNAVMKEMEVSEAEAYRLYLLARHGIYEYFQDGGAGGGWLCVGQIIVETLGLDPEEYFRDLL